MTSLAERLGHSPDTRLVIISCDDLGSCHAANEGVFDALRHGVATCASLMVPAPWARHAAMLAEPTDDVGVHLTLNCEHPNYRFGPITHAPSLLSGEGGFPRDLDDLWNHADPAEVLRECRAQIERAMAWGIDVTHLAPHLSAIMLRPEFFDVYLELAIDFGLPLRMGPVGSERIIGFPARELAAAEGVVFPDHLVLVPVGGRLVVEQALFDLRPGVTELSVHPAVDTDELRASHPDWAGRVEDHALLCADPAFVDLVERSGATLIGYRELRELQRAG